jgi:hypothetical protein
VTDVTDELGPRDLYERDGCVGNGRVDNLAYKIGELASTAAVAGEINRLQPSAGR